MLYEFTDRYGQSWAIEMPEGGVGFLRSPLNPEQPLTAADALGSEVLRLAEEVRSDNEIMRDFLDGIAEALGVERPASMQSVFDGARRLAERVRELERDIVKEPSPYFRGLAEGRREAEKRIAALEEENATLRADNLSLVGDAGAKGIADVAWRWFREALGEKALKPLDEVLNGPALERIMDPRSTAIVADAAALEALSDHLVREVEKRHSISDVFRGPAEEAARAAAPLFSPEVWRHIVERYLSPPPAAEPVLRAEMPATAAPDGEVRIEAALTDPRFREHHPAKLSEQEEAFHEEWLMLVKNHETVNMTVLALIAAKRTGLIAWTDPRFREHHPAKLSEQEEAFHEEWLMLYKNLETTDETVLALIAAKRTGLI